MRCLALILLAALLSLPLTSSQPAWARKKKAPAQPAPQEQTQEADPDLAKERRIGQRAVEEIEKEWPLVSDPAVLARLNMILNRLEPHMERRIPYEIRIVQTEVQNAFCIVGGFIFFTTGILDLLKTDSELAAVMAHEMVHADQKHSLKMAAQSNKVTLGALAAMVLSGGAVAPIVLAQVAQVAITNAYSIELETEADSRGLDALIAAGYPPAGMVTLMEKFLSEEMRQPIRDYGIYMNHPDSKKRVRSALEKLHRLGIPVRRKIPLGLLRTSFHETKSRLELRVDDVPVWSGKRSLEAREAVERARGVLDAELQLETAPYDVHLVGDSLYIGNRPVTGPVEGMEDPDIFRKNLLKALDRARRKHPMAKYFQ